MLESLLLTAALLSGQLVAQVDITSRGDFVRGVPNDGDWPGGEAPPLVIDDDTNTKFLHFKGESQPSGFQVTPSTGATIVTGLAVTTANDAPQRDPVAFELSGSNVSIDGPYTLIAHGEIVDFAQVASWPRLTRNTTPITFPNEAAYAHYQLLFTGVRDAASANSMQVAEVELLGSPAAGLPPEIDPGEIDDPFWDSSLVISEFQAVNETGMSTIVEGKTVPPPDWIEIHNRGTAPVSLAGWYLTDDPNDLTKWALPAVGLVPGGFLVVFASGIQEQDHPENWPYRDQAGYYHANFSLDGDGEYLALVGPDLQVAHEYGSCMGGDSQGFPPQRADLSYGLYGNQEQYFTTPSAGRANPPGYAEISAEPVFSHPAGTFAGYFLLELSSPNPAAEIRFTLDGQVPTPGAPKYQAPVPIAGTSEVVARAYEPGKAPSAAVSRTYIALANDVLGFNSNLPIVIVDTGRRNIGGNFVKVSAVVIDTGTQGRALITEPPDFHGRAGIKRRGSSTQNAAKPSYALEVRDENDQDRDVSVLGLPADSDWILYSPYTYDRALISNALVFDLSSQVGRYAVRTRFVEMYLNTNDDTVSAGDYVGLYILMEKIKRGEERVDIEELEPWDSTEPRIAGGYLLKIDRRDPGDTGFHTSRGNPTFGGGTLCYVEPKEAEITAAQSAWVRGYLDAFENALYGPDFANPQTGYARFIDVDSFIDHNLLNMLAMNVDALRLSTYLYKTRGGKLEMGPLWDFDRALDSTDGRDDNAQTWHGTGDATDYHRFVWWDRLFADAEFWQKYIDRWYVLRKGPFSTASLNATIDAMADEIREAQARNFQKWSSQGPRFGGFQGEIDHLKQWLQTRCTWVDGQFVAPPGIVPDGGHLAAGGVVSLVNPHANGVLYYTLDGSDPRPPGVTSIILESTVLVPENASKRALVPAGPVDEAWRGERDFDDSSWTSGAGGAGFERGSGYQNFLGIDLGDQMYGSRSSCYIRIPFTISDAQGTCNFMTLNMRYDDGFVAWLNGVEIQRALFSGTPAWNSSADGNHDDSAAMAFEEFDVSAHAGLLKKGANVLAIQGMNSSPTSSDLLFSIELSAGRRSAPTDNGLPGAVHEYTGPITIARSSPIKARVFVAGNPYSPWSGLAQAVFAVGPVAQSLRVSEIMYHPPDPNAEFIELTNVGVQTINLNLVKFADGVDFTFPSFELAPGGYVLVVRDLTAFETMYAPGLPIAGTYAGGLDNGGERIELQDAAGQIIHSFRFEDDWYRVTDGPGFSLTVADPATTEPGSLGQKSVWRPSTHVGGSPGYDDE